MTFKKRIFLNYFEIAPAWVSQKGTRNEFFLFLFFNFSWPSLARNEAEMTFFLNFFTIFLNFLGML